MGKQRKLQLKWWRQVQAALGTGCCGGSNSHPSSLASYEPIYGRPLALWVVRNEHLCVHVCSSSSVFCEAIEVCCLLVPVRYVIFSCCIFVLSLIIYNQPFPPSIMPEFMLTCRYRAETIWKHDVILRTVYRSCESFIFGVCKLSHRSLQYEIVWKELFRFI